MQREHGKLEGDVEVNGYLKFHGMITGSAIIRSGAHIDLHGMVARVLMVETGATAKIHGMVVGNVINKGGEIEIYGTVNGSVQKESGNTFIDPRAVVQGHVSV